jgi:tetratricopeptide (TPR) repeat protein
VRFNLGLALAIEEDWEGAEGEFERAVEGRPELSEARWRLARVLIRRGKIAQAKAQCEYVLRVEPNNLDTKTTWGMVLAEEKEYIRALEEFKEVIRLKPGNVEARLEAGHALVAAGRIDEAVKEYQIAASLNTNMGVALLQRARYFVEAGRGDVGIEMLRAATQLAPNDIPAREKLASLLAQCGRSDEAINTLSEVVRLRPDAESHCNLAIALANKGDITSAIEHYRDAIRIKPDWPVAYNNLAWLRATFPEPNIRNGAEAVQLSEKACQLTKFREPVLVGTLAAAYAEAGRFEDAVVTSQKALDLAREAGRTEMVARNAELVEKYRIHQPHREAPSAP